MNWYVIDKEYVKYLSDYDRRVGFVDYGDRLKLHIGVVLTVNNMKYYVPVSSPKEKHFTMSNTIDFHRIEDPDTRRLYAVINLNNMIPVPEDKVTQLFYRDVQNYRAFSDDREKNKYIFLLKREKAIIDRIADKLTEKASRLYKEVVRTPDSKVSKRCCNFPALEEMARRYNTYVKTENGKDLKQEVFNDPEKRFDIQNESIISDAGNDYCVRDFIMDRYEMNKSQNIFIAKRMLVDSIYQQANLEGIAVTYAQTQDIMNNVNVDKLTPNEISKVCCLRDGWKYLLDNIDKKVDLMYIEELHEIVARFDVDYRYLGKLRTEQVLISGTSWKPGLPDYDQIEKVLADIDKEHITDSALKMGLSIMRVQPFQDGNKRIGSFIINKILIENGRGLFNVPVKLDGIFKTKLVEYYENEDYLSFGSWIRKNCLIGIGEIENIKSYDEEDIVRDDRAAVNLGVIEMLRKGFSYDEIAAAYNIEIATISAIHDMKDRLYPEEAPGARGDVIGDKLDKCNDRIALDR